MFNISPDLIWFPARVWTAKLPDTLLETLCNALMYYDSIPSLNFSISSSVTPLFQRRPVLHKTGCPSWAVFFPEEEPVDAEFTGQFCSAGCWRACLQRFLRFYELLVQYRVLAPSDDLGQAGQCAHIGMIVGNREGFHCGGELWHNLSTIGNITLSWSQRRVWSSSLQGPGDTSRKYFQQALITSTVLMSPPTVTVALLAVPAQEEVLRGHLRSPGSGLLQADRQPAMQGCPYGYRFYWLFANQPIWRFIVILAAFILSAHAEFFVVSPLDRKPIRLICL